MYGKNRTSKYRLFIKDLSELEKYGFHFLGKGYYLNNGYVNVKKETKQLTLCSLSIDDFLTLVEMFNNGIIEVIDYDKIYKEKQKSKVESDLKKLKKLLDSNEWKDLIERLNK